MSFEEIWQENKGYILSLLGGFIVFLTAYLIIDGSFESDIRRNEAAKARHERNAKRARIPRGRTSELDRELVRLEEELTLLEGELTYKPREGFTLAGVADAPDIHFNRVIQSMLSDIVEPAASIDMRIPSDLGLMGRTPKSRAEYEWYLNGLDIVKRVCEAGIGVAADPYGNTRIDGLDPIKIVAPKKKKRQRRESNPYLTELRVELSVRGRPGAVDGLIRALMEQGARIAIESARVSSLDDRKKEQLVATDPMVQADLTLKALIVDAEGEPQVSKSAKR